MDFFQTSQGRPVFHSNRGKRFVTFPGIHAFFDKRFLQTSDILGWRCFERNYFRCPLAVYVGPFFLLNIINVNLEGNGLVVVGEEARYGPVLPGLRQSGLPRQRFLIGCYVCYRRIGRWLL